MGGCCCSASKGPEEINAPQCRHLPRTLEEHIPLSSPQATASSLSTVLLVHTNLETSTIDTFRPPPPPMSYDVDLGHVNSQPTVQELCGNKSNEVEQTANSESVDATAMCKDLKEPECKADKALCDLEPDVEEPQEVEVTKLVGKKFLTVEEEDACPICLEEYDTENPKLSTTCKHEYHLACILEWMERSGNCPVCDQICTF